MYLSDQQTGLKTAAGLTGHRREVDHWSGRVDVLSNASSEVSCTL